MEEVHVIRHKCLVEGNAVLFPKLNGLFQLILGDRFSS